MEKFYTVTLVNAGANFNANPYFKKREDADRQAKTLAAQYSKSNPGQYTVIISEAIAITQVPVPNIDLIELK